MLEVINKSIQKDTRYINIAEAYLNIKLENRNTPNEIKKKYKDTDHKIALYETDLKRLKPLYERIYKDNDYDKNNSFILALSILLISKILNINAICILNNLGIN